MGKKKVEKNCFQRVYGYVTIPHYCVLCAVHSHISSYLLQDVWSQIMFTV